MATMVQAPVIEYIVPEYGALVNKKIVTDDSVDLRFTMTINSVKKMSRAEVIEFYENSFRLDGYRLTPIDGKTVLLSKKQAAGAGSAKRPE